MRYGTNFAAAGTPSRLRASRCLRRRRGIACSSGNRFRRPGAPAWSTRAARSTRTARSTGTA
ncbi:MAG: hypothetical protein ACJ79V_18935, partial [Myxococcales bacterium]